MLVKRPGTFDTPQADAPIMISEGAFSKPYRRLRSTASAGGGPLLYYANDAQTNPAASAVVRILGSTHKPPARSCPPASTPPVAKPPQGIMLTSPVKKTMARHHQALESFEGRSRARVAYQSSWRRQWWRAAFRGYTQTTNMWGIQGNIRNRSDIVHRSKLCSHALGFA